MRLTVRILGVELLHVDLSTDSPSPEPEDDTARDLSGGNLGSDRIEASEHGMYLGFTNGREDE